MALRFGAIAAYEFSELIQSIDGNVAKCPSVKSARDDAKMGEAREVFKAAFPKIELLRHGAAHGTEFGSTQKKLDEHTSSEPFEHPFMKLAPQNLYASRNVVDRTYFCTVRGKTVQYTLDREHREALWRAVELVWAAFRPVGDAIEAQARSRGE